MAFKLRLQIFFVILTVVPLLVGGWMIQRTVVESRRSSIDQRLAGGVGTLGAQYASVLASGKRELETLPRNGQLQTAIADKDYPTVRRLVDLAQGGGLRIVVKDASGKRIAGTPSETARPIGKKKIGTDPLLTTVETSADVSYLITLAEQSNDDVKLGLATGNRVQLADEQLPLSRPLVLGRPFKLKLQDASYRAAASSVADSQVVALYP